MPTEEALIGQKQGIEKSKNIFVAHYHKLLSHNDIPERPLCFCHLSCHLKTCLVSLTIMCSASLLLHLILNYLCHSPLPPFHSASSPLVHSVLVLKFLLPFPTPSPPLFLLSSCVSLSLDDQGRSRTLHGSEEEIILHIKACKGC